MHIVLISVYMSPRKKGLRLHICLVWFLLTTTCFSDQSDAGSIQQLEKPPFSMEKLSVRTNDLILSTSTPLPSQENQPPYCSYPPLAPKPPSPPFPGQSPPQRPPRMTPNPPYCVPSPPESTPWPEHALWCVAKPTVPREPIQAALDYACGSGADCEPIRRNGLCFQPDTLLAHASYAFNSLWQKTKLAGGTCDFGGTAMLVTVDPSYDHCHFIYA